MLTVFLMNGKYSGNINRMMKCYIILIIFNILFWSGCSHNDTPAPLEVNGVYYLEKTDDASNYGEEISQQKLMYFIAIDLKTDLLAHPINEFLVDWKDICQLQNNSIIWSDKTDIKGDKDILLRLKNPYDPLLDNGKRIYFIDKMFTLDVEYYGWVYQTHDTSGTYDVHDGDPVFISSKSKKIIF